MVKEALHLNNLKSNYPLEFLALIALAFLFYSNTFANGWTLDDFPVIVNNPDIKSLGGFLTNSYPGRPLREITFLIDHAFFGLDPVGYHFQNILWHGLNGCLVYLLARRLTLLPIPAFLAACLFLLHPIQVEVVANISHRKDSLALFFCLVSSLCYWQFLKDLSRAKWLWLLAAVGSAAVAMLAKQNALIMPMVFLLIETVESSGKRCLLTYKRTLWALGIVAAASALSWLLFAGGREAHLNGIVELLVKFNYYPDWTESAYFMTVLKSWVFMLGKYFWPVNLAVEYTYSVPVAWSDLWVVTGLVGTVGALGWLLWARLKSPLFFFMLQRHNRS